MANGRSKWHQKENRRNYTILVCDWSARRKVFPTLDANRWKTKTLKINYLWASKPHGCCWRSRRRGHHRINNCLRLGMLCLRFWNFVFLVCRVVYIYFTSCFVHVHLSVSGAWIISRTTQSIQETKKNLPYPTYMSWGLKRRQRMLSFAFSFRITKTWRKFTQNVSRFHCCSGTGFFFRYWLKINKKQDT